MYRMLLKAAAVDMVSKAKGTDNPVGLNCFRMCAFHQFLYISTAFVLVLFLAASPIILGVSVGPSSKWQCESTHFLLPNKREPPPIHNILWDIMYFVKVESHSRYKIKSQMVKIFLVANDCSFTYNREVERPLKKSKVVTPTPHSTIQSNFVFGYRWSYHSVNVCHVMP